MVVMSQMAEANEPIPLSYQPRPPRRLLRRVVWAHVLGSYAWMLCYAPGVFERMQADPTLPMTAKILGGLIGFLLAPLAAPAIILAAPVAAVAQDRPLRIIYFFALSLYSLCA